MCTMHRCMELMVNKCLVIKKNQFVYKFLDTCVYYKCVCVYSLII